MLCSNI